MGCIKSILDTDKYKLTMQQAMLEHYPDSQAVYLFKNRDPADKFTEDFVDYIKEEIQKMANLC